VKRGSSAMSWKSESERALDAVARVETDGFGEVLEAVVGVSGHAGEDGEAVEGVVRAGVVRRGFFSTGCARLRSCRR